MMKLLKKLPIDLGQGHWRNVTKGKQIARSLIKESDGMEHALDIGCREGTQTQWLKNKGYITTSIDIEKVYEHCLVVDVNRGLPFQDNTFTLIWCSEVIEHLDNPSLSIKEMVRILKPGGKLIITTPNSYCLPFKILYLMGFLPSKLQNSGHKHFFNYTSFNTLLKTYSKNVYGYFFYLFGLRFKIYQGIGLLSPTFIVEIRK